MNDRDINTFNTHNTIPPWRIYVIAAAIGLVLLRFVFQLFFLQIIEGEVWQTAAENNRTNLINLQTQRGIIVDRNGTTLARNVASYNVVITAANLPDSQGDIQKIFRELARLIDMPVNLNELSEEYPYVPCISPHGIAQIAQYAITSKPYDPVRIKCNIEEPLARIIQEKAADLPGVGIEIESVREYPTGSLTANLIGYLGPIPAELKEQYDDQGFVAGRDKVGYAGIELQYQDLLSGRNGYRTVEVDVAGQILRDLRPITPTIPGANIELTIDVRLQKAAETLLIQEMTELNNISTTGIRATSGVVIAINPKTGEILAMVSYPSYENNRFARIIPFYYYQQLESDGTEPLLNHAVQAERPAGSVFKLVTAVGALNEGVVTPDQMIKTPGVISLEQKFYANDPGSSQEFVDWNYNDGQNPEGFGQLNIYGCISHSSNVCFYKLGGGYFDEIPQGLGVCNLGTYARALGYGQPSGIELPGEEDGLLPDPRWKRITRGENWSTGDTYIASVGQGYVLVTPLQVLLSAATIANDGTLMQPTILHRVFDGEGNEIQGFTPKPKWNITQDPVIEIFAPTASISNSCQPTGELKSVDPQVIQIVQNGMRQTITDPEGTLHDEFATVNIAAAGKTGTAEYCDTVADQKGLCIPGRWPTHAWTVAYAPFEDPEIAVVAFVYNGGEGAKIAGPIVRQFIEYYFNLKAIDAALGAPTP